MTPVNRNSNPFATCWTAPSAVSYVPLEEASPCELVSRLAAANWWGQIVGPHGAGKTTLLHALEPLVKAKHRSWHALRFHSFRQGSPWRELFRLPLHGNSLLVIDGFEQLSPLLRWSVQLRCWRTGCGLLVTSHQSVGLPMLVEVAPDRQVIHQVFCELVAGTQTTVTDLDFLNAFNACNGDIRQMFSNLYDLHEWRSREAKSMNQPPGAPVVQTMDETLMA